MFINQINVDAAKTLLSIFESKPKYKQKINMAIDVLIPISSNAMLGLIVLSRKMLEVRPRPTIKERFSIPEANNKM